MTLVEEKSGVLYWIGLVINIHLSIVVYSMLAVVVCKQLNSLPDTKPHQILQS